MKLSGRKHLRRMRTRKHSSSLAIPDLVSSLMKAPCGLIFIEIVWQLVQVSHGSTIRNLVWEFCHGSCGIPENITAAIKLAKKFPQYVTPGTKFYLSEWTNEVYLDWEHFLQVCKTGECSQTLYYYYINHTRSSCEDDAKDTLAHTYLKKAATLGLAEAQYTLAQETWWENRDFHVCSELLQQAADQGHEYARKLLKTVKNQEISFPQW